MSHDVGIYVIEIETNGDWTSCHGCLRRPVPVLWPDINININNDNNNNIITIIVIVIVPMTPFISTFKA